MNGFVKGFTSSLSPKGLGGVAFVVAVLVVIYAFAPQFSPQGLAAKIGGGEA